MSQEEPSAGFERSEEILDQLLASSALVNRAQRALQAKEWAEAARISQEAIDGFLSSTDDDVRRNVAEAMVLKAFAHEGLEERDACHAIVDRAVKCFGDSDAPGIVREVLMAMVIKATSLRNVGNPSAGVAVCNRMIRRYGKSTQKDVRYRLAQAWVTKGQCLGDMKNRVAAIKAYDQVLDRFDDTEDNSWHVSEAMAYKASLLDRPEEAGQSIALCEEVERRFAHLDDEGVRRNVVCAAFVRTMRISKTADSDRYPDLVREFLRRFGGSEDPFVQRFVQAASLIEATGFPTSP